MRGEFSGVGSEIDKEIFEPFMVEASIEDIQTEELWIDLFREAVPSPAIPVEPIPTAFDSDGNVFRPEEMRALEAYKIALAKYQTSLEAYSDASANDSLAHEYMVDFFNSPTTSERQIVKALEDAFDAIQDFGGDALSNRYFLYVQRFLEKYSLRYDLRRPFGLHPTLPGMFAQLIRELKELAGKDATLSGLMYDFEECVRDLKSEQSPRKIKQCLSAQFNLLEALLKHAPDVVEHNAKVKAHNATASMSKQRKPVNTFGAMCTTARVWPHKDVLASAKSIYNFCSDYPGIRHGGTPENKLREIDMRDMISMTIVLAGFTPYFSDALNSEKIYLD